MWIENDFTAGLQKGARRPVDMGLDALLKIMGNYRGRTGYNGVLPISRISSVVIRHEYRGGSIPSFLLLDKYLINHNHLIICLVPQKSSLIGNAGIYTSLPEVDRRIVSMGLLGCI